MRNSRKHASLLITCVAALGLVACGGDATVENDPATELSSVAPLTRDSATSSATSESSSDSESSQSSAAPSSGAPAPVEPLPQDGAAKEIEEIPAQTIERSPGEEAFLAEVAKGEIDITGVEEQLIGAAATVCESVETGNENVIVPAVAGQLAEQGKTQLPVEEAATLIESAAESAYC